MDETSFVSYNINVSRPRQFLTYCNTKVFGMGDFTNRDVIDLVSGMYLEKDFYW